MTLRTTALIALLLMSSFAVAAEESVWKDEHGKPVPDTDWQKSVAGFGGLLIVTPDKDWKAKWSTPSETAPNFTTTDTVGRGGELSILAFFTNPKPDASGMGSVSMDIDIARPDGSSSSHAEGAACFKGKIQGPAYNMYLCASVAEFVGEAADPAGTWSVRITLKDEVRKVSVPLATKFELVESKEAAAEPTTVDIQGADEWKRSPQMRAYYDETIATFKNGTDIDVAAYEARSFAIFREFARANGMNEAAMLDHLKLIPRQIVGIVKENPAVLKDYDSFWAALAGPD
jgi:hypothetical protein